MSCIPKMLELKGDKDYIFINEATILEGGGNYKGFDYCITFRDLGFRCTYIAINKDSEFYKKNNGKDSWELGIRCHGDITFFDPPEAIIRSDGFKPVCDDIWIGFDAGHADDSYDIKRLGEVFGKIKENQTQSKIDLASRMNEFNKTVPWNTGAKSYVFMEKQCKKIINQLIKKEEE